MLKFWIPVLIVGIVVVVLVGQQSDFSASTKPVMRGESSVVEDWHQVKPYLELHYLHLAKSYVLPLQDGQRNKESVIDSTEEYLMSFGYNAEYDSSLEKVQAKWGVKEWAEYQAFNDRYAAQLESITSLQMEYIMYSENNAINLADFRVWYDYYIASNSDPIEYIDYRFKTLND